MGIAAAGNSGTVVTNLVAPRLAAHVGWHGVFGIAMIPLAARPDHVPADRARSAGTLAPATPPWQVLRAGRPVVVLPVLQRDLRRLRRASAVSCRSSCAISRG